MWRREFVAAAPTLLLGASSLIACSKAPDPESYESVTALIRRPHVARRILVSAGQEPLLFDGEDAVLH